MSNYLTLTEFRASGVDVNDQELAQATGQSIDNVSPDGGRVYAGSTYLELDGQNQWTLTLGNQGWTGELKTLEAILYGYARTEHMDKPADEQAAFIDEWQTFCRDEGLPADVDADHMNIKAKLNTMQYSYVQDYMRRWDEWALGDAVVYKATDDKVVDIRAHTVKVEAGTPEYMMNDATRDLIQGLAKDRADVIAALREIMDSSTHQHAKAIAQQAAAKAEDSGSMDDLTVMNVEDYFRAALGETLQLDDAHQNLVSGFTLDTPCGHDCRKAIDATLAFLNCVTERTNIDRVGIIDECRQCVTVFMFG